MAFCYQAFGLTIDSEIDCEQWLSGAEGKADVRVRIAKVPASLGQAVSQGLLFEAAANKLLLKIDRIATYLVSEGREILVDPSPEADPDSVRLFLLGSAFGALLQQRGVLLLHASAVAGPGGAILFAGPSGCGKSTLAGVFHKNGYSVVTDEICAVTVNSQPLALRGNPFLMLWADALDEMRLNRGELRRARPQLNKYILPAQRFAVGNESVRAIYIVEPTNDEPSPPVAVKGLAKIDVLTRNLYRPQFVEPMGCETACMRQVAQLAQRVPIKRLLRPRRSCSPQRLFELIEQDLKS